MKITSHSLRTSIATSNLSIAFASVLRVLAGPPMS